MPEVIRTASHSRCYRTGYPRHRHLEGYRLREVSTAKNERSRKLRFFRPMDRPRPVAGTRHESTPGVVGAGDDEWLVLGFLNTFPLPKTRELYGVTLRQLAAWSAANGVDLVHADKDQLEEFIGSLRERSGIKDST